MRLLSIVVVAGLCMGMTGCALRPVRTCLDHALVCAGGMAAAAGAYYVLRDDPEPTP